MDSHFINRDPMILVSNLDSFLTMRPPDCVIYTEDGGEYPIHKVRGRPFKASAFFFWFLTSVLLEMNKHKYTCFTHAAAAHVRNINKEPLINKYY